jgi:fatty acid-binding protein DegV
VPIMGNDGDGGIELKVQVRGEKKALNKLIEMIGENNINFTNTILSITYVTAMEKAQAIKEEIQRIYNFKDVLIFKAGGLSTIYADDGGIVIAY